MLETSVLLLHYNKNYEILLILEALCKQTVRKDSFEIIIIDDGSDNSIKNEVDYYKTKNLIINLIELQHSGNRAAARNLAVEKASGENIIFLDADMIPSNNFIERHLNNINSGRNIVSYGFRHLLYGFPQEYITPEVIEKRYDILENMPCLLDERESFIYSHEKLNVNLSEAWYIGYSHNFGLKKTLYTTIEGFDSNFKYGWGVEDVELAFQLYKAGAKFIYDTQILLYHICHKSSFNENSYNRNLQYFYNKYKSFEPELFMTQHIQNPKSMAKLYDDIKKHKHLSLISDDVVTKFENSLFVGFKETDLSIIENGNKLISTCDKNAEFNLIGTVLPYQNNSFDQVLLSANYEIFSNEFLFIIIRELLRVGKKVYVYNMEKKEELDFYWKRKTGYTFEEFLAVPKVRVLITPSSVKRQNNVLFVELAKALSMNGFYVSLELAGDELKDFYDIYPLIVQNNIIKSIYSREFRFLPDKKITIIDNSSNNFVYMDNVLSLWWGDIPLYGQNREKFFLEKQNFNGKLSRNKYDSLHLLPGVRSEEINELIRNPNFNEKNGILIIDLYLDNLSLIREIIDHEKVKNTSVTIVTLYPRLDEHKIYKNSKFRSLKYMNNKQMSFIRNIQDTYTKRLNELIDYSFCMNNVSICNSTGDITDIDRYIRDNTDYFDFNSTSSFNPYVLEAAAFGLRVYTTSDIYMQYEYENIYQIDYTEKNAILDTEIYVDRNWIVKPEILAYKREIIINKLFERYEKEKQTEINKENILNLNKKYDWKIMIKEFNNNILNRT